jgi:hypothetical protein
MTARIRIEPHQTNPQGQQPGRWMEVRKQRTKMLGAKEKVKGELD